jgi:hypothetical protein
MVAHAEEIREPRDRSPGYDVVLPADSLDIRLLNSRAETESLNHFAEKLRAQSPWLDQCNRPINQAGDHDAWQSSP